MRAYTGKLGNYQRLPNADYYTDDKKDAKQTALCMIPHTWYAGSGRPLTLTLTYPQILNMSHQGDCSEDVESALPSLAGQTAGWSDDAIRSELREIGYLLEDLDNRERNIARLVWIAAGELKEEIRQNNS